MTQNPYGPPPGQYPPQPQGYAPYPSTAPAGQQAPGAAPTGANPFNTPGAPTGGAASVRLHQLVGRLVILKVTGYDPASRFEDGPAVPQAVCEAIVCDGPPITGAVDGRTQRVTEQFPQPKVAPFHIGALYVRSATMAPQLLPFLNAGVTLGRVANLPPTGTKIPPYVLNPPTPEEIAMAVPINEAWAQIAAAGAPPAQPVTQPFQQPAAPAQYQPQQAPAGAWQQPAQQPYQPPAPQHAQYPPAPQYPSPEQYQQAPAQPEYPPPPPGWAPQPEQPAAPAQQQPPWDQPQQAGGTHQAWPPPPSTQPWTPQQ